MSYTIMGIKRLFEYFYIGITEDWYNKVVLNILTIIGTSFSSDN